MFDSKDLAALFVWIIIQSQHICYKSFLSVVFIAFPYFYEFGRETSEKYGEKE